MTTISERLRDYGLTDDADIIVQQRRVIDEAADTIDALVAALEDIANDSDVPAWVCAKIDAALALARKEG